MRDTDTIVDALVDEGAILVLEYGSSVHKPAAANDIDLFALYEAGTPRTSNVRLGAFEVIRLTKPAFRRYRSVLNPVHCTEPVLKGVVRHGSESAFEAVRVDVEGLSPTNEAIQHNLRRSYEEYCKAWTAFENGDNECALRSLSFAVSYRLFAGWYADGNTPATMDRVIDEAETAVPVEDVFGLLDDVKDGQAVSDKRIADLFTGVNQAILTG
jgi:hypothetical protein